MPWTRSAGTINSGGTGATSRQLKEYLSCACGATGNRRSTWKHDEIVAISTEIDCDLSSSQYGGSMEPARDWSAERRRGEMPLCFTPSTTPLLLIDHNFFPINSLIIIGSSCALLLSRSVQFSYCVEAGRRGSMFREMSSVC